MFSSIPTDGDHVFLVSHEHTWTTTLYILHNSQKTDYNAAVEHGQYSHVCFIILCYSKHELTDRAEITVYHTWEQCDSFIAVPLSARCFALDLHVWITLRLFRGFRVSHVFFYLNNWHLCTSDCVDLMLSSFVVLNRVNVVNRLLKRTGPG